MPSNAQWAIQIDVYGESLPHPKEGWVRCIVNVDVAKQLRADLEFLLDSEVFKNRSELNVQDEK